MVSNYSSRPLTTFFKRLLDTSFCTIILSALIFSCVTISADEPELQEIYDAVQSLNTAFENSDRNAIESLMTKDHVAVARMYKGKATVEQQTRLLPEVELDMYDMSKPTIRLLAADVAHVTLTVSLRGNFRGEPLPKRLLASAIWVKHDGRWLQYFYQETDIGEQ
ncbi:MAG: hypothetical protein DHS20C01_22840 [marine bacterium B5-7]|nr:MAG: hypothetical protein DHS20C01_22840 [marine bacterium B5-7]